MVISRDREQSVLAVPRHCRNVVAGCSNSPTYRTTFCIMTFRDGQDTGTDGDCRYGVIRTVKHSTGSCGTGTGAGVTYTGPVQNSTIDCAHEDFIRMHELNCGLSSFLSNEYVVLWIRPRGVCIHKSIKFTLTGDSYPTSANKSTKQTDGRTRPIALPSPL